MLLIFSQVNFNYPLLEVFVVCMCVCACMRVCVHAHIYVYIGKGWGAMFDDKFVNMLILCVLMSVSFSLNIKCTCLGFV